MKPLLIKIHQLLNKTRKIDFLAPLMLRMYLVPVFWMAGTKKIEGFEGIYFVKDKMHSRWKNRIDIYMGVDVKAAKEWGRKKVCIEYGIPKND